MIRLCDKAINCPDPGDPLLGLSSLEINPAVPADTGVVFGDPDTGIVFGIPDQNIALGYPIKYCPGIHCPGDDFLNFSTECDDVDYLADRLLCTCLGEATNIMFRAPGVGPYTWTVDNLPDGLLFLVDHPCTGILSIFGVITTPGQYFATVTVTDGFGNLTVALVQFNVLQILTTSLPDVTIGTPYNFQLQATGGSGFYGWHIVSGALAPGLILLRNGTIFGTPTDIFPAILTLEVRDLQCEEPGPLTPYVVLTGESVTTTARVIGFPGFATPIPPIPPKAYKTIDWSGTVMNAQQMPLGISRTTILGYCGTTNIDIDGLELTYRSESGYFNDFRAAIPPSARNNFHGQPEINGTPVTLTGPCLFGPVVASGFLSGDIHVQAGAFAAGPSASARDATLGLAGEGGYTVVVSDTQAEKHKIGTIAGRLYNVNKVVVLSNEYTDAEALLKATVLPGTGLVAMSLPRVTGWISTWTTVTYTLACHNLMPGQNYLATVELFSSTGASVIVPYAFTAAAADYTITAPIPVPPNGTWVAAINPQITIAP